MSQIRTRFAPSPTGHLHIGGARTALFNWLYARHHGGSFVLRIEDTDQARSEQQYVDAILQGLAWLGIDYDEGPFYQSQRGEFYARLVERMLTQGDAYHCFCKPADLDAQRTQAQADGRRYVYDRRCRQSPRRPGQGEPAVVRLASPTEGTTVVEDLIRGPVSFANAELDDIILVRSDGAPTFHLVVVADDLDMGITHIFRGEDHLSNTPKQIPIYHALGATPPKYGHLPLIVGKDRARLSKRHGATSVFAYRDEGFLPVAMQNYLARLGWSHGDQELFSSEELVALFDIDAVGKSASAFDMEKLTWVNSQHLKGMPAATLAEAAVPYCEAVGISRVDLARLARAVDLNRDRAKTMVELVTLSRFMIDDELRFDPKAVAKFLGEDGCELLGAVEVELKAVESWTLESIRAAFEGLMETRELKLGKLAQPVRVALSGGTVSPGIFEVCELLGSERTLARLAFARQGAIDGNLPPVEPKETAS
ncbi:MAG: glutamyl-tRNA synthetase [Hyphomicrobiaceae bacterium]|jgi:glutamyl-tRNA synthetase